MQKAKPQERPMEYLVRMFSHLLAGVTSGKIDPLAAARCIENSITGESTLYFEGVSQLLDQPVTVLNLSNRALNALREPYSAGVRLPSIETIRQLVSLSTKELPIRCRVGKVTLQEICTRLEEKKLFLGMLPPED